MTKPHLVQRIYSGKRHGRVMFLAYLSVLALVASIAAVVRGMWTGDRDTTHLGWILTGFFLLSTGALEFYARRYVSALEEDDEGIHVETKSLTGRRRPGLVSKMGPEIRQVSDSYDNRHHRITAGPNHRTYILDVTSDPDIVPALRRALTRSSRGR